jgi:hypothetical protein
MSRNALTKLALAVAIMLLVAWYYNHWRQIRADVDACAECLPSPLSMSYEFSESSWHDPNSDKRKVTTIRDKLIELRAYCRDGIIYDGNGNKIAFHRKVEFGIPPDWQTELAYNMEKKELQRLETEGYSVVSMWQTRVPK